MRLLYLSENISISETFIADLSRGLSDKFDVCHVVAHEPFYTKDINFKVINYDISAKAAEKLNYILESRGKKILYFLRKKRAVQKLKEAVRNSDAVFVDYGTTAVRILPLIKEFTKPLIVHFHGFDITSQLSSSWYQKDLKKLYEIGSIFIVASYHIKRLLVLNGCPEKKIEVVRLGVNIPHELYSSIPPYELKKTDFIFIGRLTPKKHPIALIHAFKKVQTSFPNITLKLVGNGPLKSECIDLINHLQLSKNVEMPGAVSHNVAMDLLKDSKIYVQHSVTSLSGDQEGFAISLAEAAMMEMPVVSTLHNGIPENVVDGITGFLVREFDYETMGNRMIELLQNPGLAKEMGRKGKEHINKLCSNTHRTFAIGEIIKKSFTK